MKTVVILISGRGSNLEALLEAKLPVHVGAVISNKPGAGGLEVARRHGLETAVVDHRSYPDRETFDAALAAKIDGYSPDLVVLAGFMRILTPGFVDHYARRLINIHPSLLPAFTGLDTHGRAVAEGVKLHGCTVHFVTNELDKGPIVAQAAVPVLADDTAETLAARVLVQEHTLYPQAIRWFAEDKLELTPDGKVRFTGQTDTDCALISPQEKL